MERIALPWWERRGLAKDPEDMTPAERDTAQILLLQQWLWRIGAESSEREDSLAARERARLARKTWRRARAQRQGVA